MIHRIVGTAGHIDHGKTALVAALTGVQTDRLAEEQRRGITIDLGFAPLDLGDGTRVGVVDVPGHERFIRNMRAGAGGIDLVLLVVAADESVQPQTREHFQICRLLGVQAGVVALTKVDLADADLLGLVRQEVAELVAGSMLEGAPVVEVSARTGAGVEELRGALAHVLATAPPPYRPDFARLPVDRVFSARGFGTVVTGTLLSGEVRQGETLTVHPGGDTVRVRRVEVHGQDLEAARGGQRVALNLAGSLRRPPGRGDVLAPAGRLASSRLLDARVELLAGLPAPLRDHARIRLHAGTADVEGRIRLLGGAAEVLPGSRSVAQIRLASPLALTPGDRFILRRPSPPLTLGGGVILDPVPRKHRRRDRGTGERLAGMDGASLEVRLALLVEEAGTAGITLDELVVRTGAARTALRDALADLAASGRVHADAGVSGWALAASAAEELGRRCLELLEDYHRRHPLEEGMSLEELRRRGAPRTPEPLVESILQGRVAAGDLRLSGRRAAAAGHQIRLAPPEEALLAQVAGAVLAGGFDPPRPADLLAEGGVAEARRAGLIGVLQQRGDLIRVAEGFFLHRQRVEELKALLARRRAEDPEFDVAWFKEATGTTRRAAIPLLEYLDAERITLRRGPVRFIPPAVEPQA